MDGWHVAISAERLEVWEEPGTVAGLRLGRELVPAPYVGLETEVGVAVAGCAGRHGRQVADLLARRDGIVALPARWTSTLARESRRLFHPSGSSYLEIDKPEVNSWLHVSARHARENLEYLLQEVAGWGQETGHPIVLHGAGSDGQGSSWSSAHVNVPVSRKTWSGLVHARRLAAFALVYYLPAQISLALVDGNGGVGRAGFEVSDRLGTFDQVFGSDTLRPSRAMIVTRREGFGCCRIMHMLRTLSWGPGAVAGLAATQLDTLIAQLHAHEHLDVTGPVPRDPIDLANRAAMPQSAHRTALMLAGIQIVRWAVHDRLMEDLGDHGVDRIVPGLTAALQTIDAVAAATLRGDEATLIELTDWSRKRDLFRRYAARRPVTWAQLRPELIELNVHYARLDGRALRYEYPGVETPPASCPVPAATSSWLLRALVERGLSDPRWLRDLERAHLSWSGLREVASWPPRRDLREIQLVPWSFNERTHGVLLARAVTLDEFLQSSGTIMPDPAPRAGTRPLSPIRRGPARTMQLEEGREHEDHRDQTDADPAETRGAREGAERGRAPRAGGEPSRGPAARPDGPAQPQ